MAGRGSTSDDDTGEAEIAKQHAMAADDHFDSEDTPDTTDSFIQKGSTGAGEANPR